MAGRIKTLVRSNRLRLALATGMAALGLWAFAPYGTSKVGGKTSVTPRSPADWTFPFRASGWLKGEGAART